MKRLLILLVLSLMIFPVKVSAQHCILILNKSDHTAWQLDALTGKKVAEYTTGTSPHEVAVSPDSRWAVITNYGGNTPGNSLTVVDLNNQTVAKTINLDSLQRPHGIAWFSDGRRVVVSAEAQQAVAIVDIENGSVQTTIKTDEDGSHMVELSADEQHVYVSNLGSGTISVLDIQDGEQIKTIPAGEGTEGITLVDEGKEIWATNRRSDTISIIDTETLEVSQTLNSNGFPIRAETSPDGKYVAVSNARSSEVTVFDAETRKELRKISTLTPGVENGMPIGLTFSTENNRLYVANSNANQIVVIDTISWKIIETFRTGATPDGIAYFIPN